MRSTFLALTLALMAGVGAAAPPEALVATAADSGTPVAYEGVVEAVRQTTIAAQVSGAVVELKVTAGQRVAAGELLLRIDARAAEQDAAAGAAQVRAARAAQNVAAKEFARQRQLATDGFISAAALDSAAARLEAAQAQAAAQLAQAGAVRTAAGFYAVRAPYAGVVSEVPVALGDMAMPGRSLVVLYDPAALRVSAAVPQSAAAAAVSSSAAAAVSSSAAAAVSSSAAAAVSRSPTAATSPSAAAPPLSDGRVQVEIASLPDAAQRMQTPRRVEVLPAADGATHTVTVRADLTPGLTGAMPGAFARLWLPAPRGARAASPWVPHGVVVRRAEMTGLYVLDAQDRPLLRQVRLGRSDGERVEVLSGLAPGERVALDPQAAARTTASAK